MAKATTTRTATATAPAAAEWQATTIKKAKVGRLTWKAQAVKSPEGVEMLGIKAFAAKADGSEYQSKHGFMLPTEEVTPDLLKKLKALIAVLENHIATE
jgi:hypothetical protein